MANPNHSGPFFKPKLKRKKARKKAGEKESFLQSLTDMIITLKGYHALRIPDLVYRLIGSSRTKPHEKVVLGDAFAGLPDNMIFIKVADNLSVCLSLELKTETGRLSPRQKQVAKQVGTVVCRTEQEVKEAIGCFEVAADKVREVMGDL